MPEEFGAGKRLRYLCQDETRLGLKTITAGLITAKGVKPLGLNQWQRDNFYLYGVVEPLSGYSFFYEFSHQDGDCFQRFLELLANLDLAPSRINTEGVNWKYKILHNTKYNTY